MSSLYFYNKLLIFCDYFGYFHAHIDLTVCVGQNSLCFQLNKTFSKYIVLLSLFMLGKKYLMIQKKEGLSNAEGGKSRCFDLKETAC